MKVFNTIKKSVSAVLLAGALVTSTTSCSDFLDVAPPERAGLKDAVKDYDKTLSFLYSCYSGIRAPMSGYSNFEMSSDEYVLPPLWNENGQRITWGQNSATLQADGWVWGTYYRFIGQTHLFVKTLDDALKVTDEQKREFKAEADFLLAFYHMQVLLAYGPCPINEGLVSSETDASAFTGRYHFDYVVDWISKKFDEAAEVLPASRSDEKWGRATSTAAKALKARLLVYAASPLWNGKFPYPNWKNKNFETPGYGKELVSLTYDANKWEKAKQACIEAINLATSSGGNSLYSDMNYYSQQSVPLPYVPNVPNTTENQEFLKKVMLMRFLVTTRVSEGNKEIIWSSHQQGDWVAGSVPHYVLTTSNGEARGLYSGVSPLLNTTVSYFYTKNGFRPEHDPSFTSKTDWFKTAGVSGRPDIIKLNVDREPRFYAWLAFDGGNYGSERFANGQPLTLNLKDANKQGYNVSKFPRDNNVTGYMNQKYINPKLVYNNSFSGTGDESKPRPLIRLAELYLNLAECYAELGDEAKAIENLNLIRVRAGVPSLTTADMDKQNIKEWVKNERFVELWLEGHRYFDTRRWMIAPETMDRGKRTGLSSYGKANPTFEEFNTPRPVAQDFRWYNKMYLLPIFYNELGKNPQLVQAPGY